MLKLHRKFLISIMIVTCSIIITSCKKPQSSNTNENNSKLSLFEGDDGYQMFLTYGQFPNTFEFVTCDASVEIPPTQQACHPIYEHHIAYEGLASQILESDNYQAGCDPIGTRPDHCVGAYRSNTISQICKVYPFYYKNCPEERFLELDAFCKNPLNTPMPDDFNVQRCSDLPYLERSCDAVLYNLQQVCNPLMQADILCVNSGSDPSSDACTEHQKLANDQVPFLLTDLSVSDEQYLSIQDQLNYEFYLSVKNDPTKKQVQSFGTGASVAAFMGTWDNLIKKLMPKFLRNLGFTIPYIKKKITAAPFVGISSEIAVSLIVNPYEFMYLTDTLGYTPMGRCIQSKTPLLAENKAPYEENAQLGTAFTESIIPASAGFMTNFFIKRGVQSVYKNLNKTAHPIVQVGAMFVVPFITHVVSDRLEDPSTHILKKEMDNLLTPIEGNDPNNVQKWTKIASVEQISPVLARMMIFGGKATHSSMFEYCFPKKQSDGTYIQECSPIFTGDEGHLYEIATGQKALFTGDPCEYQSNQ